MNSYINYLNQYNEFNNSSINIIVNLYIFILILNYKYSKQYKNINYG